jgi:PST family polysaccharide transporter
MWLELFRMVGIVAFMHAASLAALAVTGPKNAVLVACSSVVLVFFLSAVTYMMAIKKLDGVSLSAQVRPLLSPALACVPMVLAIYGLRRLLGVAHLFMPDAAMVTKLDHLRVFGPRLVLEIVVGAAVFVPSALVLAPRTSRELLAMVRDRRRGASSDAARAPAADSGAAGAESP